MKTGSKVPKKEGGEGEKALCQAFTSAMDSIVFNDQTMAEKYE
jgi:hypothetical protein